MTTETHGLDTAEQVFFYEQDFYTLSNFSAFNVRWRGFRFETAEHAYQWEKFRAPNRCRQTTAQAFVQAKIVHAGSAHDAFKLAQEYKAVQRVDWEDVKVVAMRGIIRCKAEQHEYVRRKLLATGSRQLIENSWRDDFWGWGPDQDGENMLGKLWMELREELRGDA